MGFHVLGEVGTTVVHSRTQPVILLLDFKFTSFTDTLAASIADLFYNRVKTEQPQHNARVWRQFHFQKSN